MKTTRQKSTRPSSARRRGPSSRVAPVGAHRRGRRLAGSVFRCKVMRTCGVLRCVDEYSDVQVC